MRISLVVLVAFLFCSAYSCKSTKDTVHAEIENQIELNLADKMSPKRIETSFNSLGVAYLCTLDTEKNICVYSFDPTKKTMEEILHFMGNEVGVESASKTKGCNYE